MTRRRSDRWNPPVSIGCRPVATGAIGIFHHGILTDRFWLAGRIDRVRGYLKACAIRACKLALVYTYRRASRTRKKTSGILISSWPVSTTLIGNRETAPWLPPGKGQMVFSNIKSNDAVVVGMHQKNIDLIALNIEHTLTASGSPSA